MTTTVEIPIEIAKRFAEQADYADSLGISFGGLAGTSQMLKDCHAIRDLIPKPKREAPPVDTLVEVHNGDFDWKIRYSAGKFSKGSDRLLCWGDGRTSCSIESVTDTASWKIWRIAEDND